MDIFKRAYERGLAEKEQLLSAVPNYTQCRWLLSSRVE